MKRLDARNEGPATDLWEPQAAKLPAVLVCGDADEWTGGGGRYEAQNVLYPKPACGRRDAVAPRGNATMPGGDEWRVGSASQSRVAARCIAAISRVALETRATERRAA